MIKESCEKLNNQAIILAEQGNFTEAINCLIRAITIEKQNDLLWFNLGVTYRDSGDLNLAEAALHQALEINPEREETIETLAQITLSANRFADTVGICSIGLSQNPDNIHLWNILGIVHFKNGDYVSASEIFERTLSINPFYYDALFNLRDTYEELGNKIGYEECCKRLNDLQSSGN